MRGRTWAIIATLAMVIATAALVAYALRSPQPPAASAATITSGAVAAVGQQTWRWTGSSDCTPTSHTTEVTYRTGDGPWSSAPVPLVNVDALTFENRHRGIAVGENDLCSRAIAITLDGGKTWTSNDANPALFDAWWVQRRIWGIDQGSGAPSIHPYLLRPGTDQLAPDPKLTPIFPCDARDGTAAHVAFYSKNAGLLLCEQAITDERLLARTTDGEIFERLTDSRGATGLDGEGPVLDLDVAGADSAWVLFPPSEECAVGQLRTSADQGATWQRLTCLSNSADVNLVLDVAFTSPEHGILLAASGNQPLMFTSDDGGQTWSAKS